MEDTTNHPIPEVLTDEQQTNANNGDVGAPQNSESMPAPAQRHRRRPKLTLQEHRPSIAGMQISDLFYPEDCPNTRPQISVAALKSFSNNTTVSAVPSNDPHGGRPDSDKLGTILGVYLPCLQHIFGLLMFIRLPWIIGTAGVVHSFILVFMCCSATFLTSISMSAIATNGKIPAGGTYYMISRALGPEFGGAVGFLFYLANTVSGALYLIGGVEVILLYIAPSMALIGDIHHDEEARFNNFRFYGTILLFLTMLIITGGIGFVNKIGAVALAGVLLSIVSIYAGAIYNINGSSYTKMCTFGNRILVHQKLEGYNCTNDLRTEGPLAEEFCHSDDIPDCSRFFHSQQISEKNGITGLRSNATSGNMFSSYAHYSGEFITDNNDDAFLGRDPKNFMVKADMMTNFIVMVGIFFPTVTGIMTGSNLSGDLKDPQESIPKGTLAAVATTSAVYVSFVFLIAGSVDNLLLKDKFGESIGGKLVVAELAWPSEWIILIGALLSSIGAGLQCLAGAPRLLQAIAGDEIIPILRPLAQTTPKGEPRRALLVTWVIAQLSVMIGDLDKISPLMDCFFLICYAFINLACALQTLLKTPNWRPRFKYYHWTLSITGLALCTAIMFMSSWYFAMVSIVIAVFLYKYIEYNGAKKEWGDGIRGLALSAARFALLRLDEAKPHMKNWRPQILLFLKLDKNLEPNKKAMLAFSSQLKVGRGLTMPVSVVQGDFAVSMHEIRTGRKNLRKAMLEEKLRGFVEVVVAEDILSGLTGLIQTAGVGGLKPNTVVMGWPNGWRSRKSQPWKLFIEMIRRVAAAKMALVVPKGISLFPASRDIMSGTIDIWWIMQDGGLVMLLPFLLHQHRTWESCKLRVFAVAQSEDNSVQMETDLKGFLHDIEIDAHVEIVELDSSDISAYNYERTLMMEERGKYLSALRMTRNESRLLLDGLIDVHRCPSSAKILACPTRPPQLPIPSVAEADEDGQEVTMQPNDFLGVSGKEDGEEKRVPNEENFTGLDTAVRLNEVIYSRSKDAKLVVVNLPCPPKEDDETSDANYMEFLDILTHGIPRLLLVRGGGNEVITMYP